MRRIQLAAIIATSIAALATATSSLAATPMPSGWYLEGNIGASKVSSVTYANNSSNSNSGFGWNANGGYKFMPYFATEVGYTHYANTSAKSAGVTVANISNYSYDIAGKAILPLADSGFDAFAKLGLARTHSHITSDNSAPGVTVNTGTNNASGAYYGVGAEYSFMPELAANAQWARAKGNNSIGKLDLYSIGVSYIRVISNRSPHLLLLSRAV